MVGFLRFVSDYKSYDQSFFSDKLRLNKDVDVMGNMGVGLAAWVSCCVKDYGTGSLEMRGSMVGSSSER